MTSTNTDDLLNRCETALHAAETILRRVSLDGQTTIATAAETRFGPDRQATLYQRLFDEIETLKDQIAAH